MARCAAQIRETEKIISSAVKEMDVTLLKNKDGTYRFSGGIVIDNSKKTWNIRFVLDISESEEAKIQKPEDHPLPCI